MTLLLTQELEYGGEIFIGVTARTHHTVELMGQGAERHRSLCVGGCVLSEAQILTVGGGREEKKSKLTLEKNPTELKIELENQKPPVRTPQRIFLYAIIIRAPFSFKRDVNSLRLTAPL